jgi:hypothetical protein
MNGEKQRYARRAAYAIRHAIGFRQGHGRWPDADTLSVKVRRLGVTETFHVNFDYVKQWRVRRAVTAMETGEQCPTCGNDYDPTHPCRCRGRWLDLPDEERAKRRCTTNGCGGSPVARFEAGNIGSDYCIECADRVERMRVRSAESNREIDELERIFGAIEDR